MKFQLIHAEKASYPVAMACRLLGVSRSGYYAWLHRAPCERVREDARLRVHVRAAFSRSGKTYGSPRIVEELRADGERVSRKRVARLMVEERLAARCKRRFVRTTQSDHDFPVAPELLRRDFSAAAPNQKWVGDITYLPTSEGFLYLAVLLDLFSRRVVGWSLNTTLEAGGPRCALERALAVRQPLGPLIHHTDRGTQYASTDYRERLQSRGIRSSMSRAGNCWDNAVAESFFSTLKAELGDVLDGRSTRQEVRDAVPSYLHFYNAQRRHSSLGYLSPLDYEAAARMDRAA